MANEPVVTLVGNLTGDPELRFIPSGAPVANFTVAQTPRVKNGDQWVDGEAMFVRCAAWRELAENVAESLMKGHRVIVQGRMTTRSYEHNGEKRTSLELDVDAIGPELRFASARPQRAERNGGQGQRPQQQSQRPQQSDPWSSPGAGMSPRDAQQATADPWARPSSGNEDPPF